MEERTDLTEAEKNEIRKAEESSKLKVDADKEPDSAFQTLHSPDKKNADAKVAAAMGQEKYEEFSADDLSKKMVPLFDIEGQRGTEVFCLRWSPDGQALATGCGDGVVRIYNAKGKLAYNLNVNTLSNLPTTCIRFRPTSSASKTQNVLISSNADGTIQHWHMTSQKRLYKIVEDDNQVFALDYRHDGEMFASAGRDCKVRIYDEQTKALTTVMSGGVIKVSPGHSNRVFSVKFREDDPNILLSAGWDNTVQIWDVRAGHSVRSIYGPHVCGDALDIKGKTILTGSWRPEDALQLWDYETGKLIKTIEWGAGLIQSAMIYSCQFSPDGQLIIAGGTGTNDARIFDHSKDDKLLSRIRLADKGIYSVDFSANGRKVAVGGGHYLIAVRELK